MRPIAKYSIVIARVLISLVFLMNGLGIVDQTMAVREVIARGAPANLAWVLVMAGRVLEVVAGAALALGILPRYSAVGLVMFLVPATLMGHAFWLATGTEVLQLQAINFFKNVSIAAGLLLIASIEDQPWLKRSPRVAAKTAREAV